MISRDPIGSIQPDGMIPHLDPPSGGLPRGGGLVTPWHLVSGHDGGPHDGRAMRLPDDDPTPPAGPRRCPPPLLFARGSERARAQVYGERPADAAGRTEDENSVGHPRRCEAHRGAPVTSESLHEKRASNAGAQRRREVRSPVEDLRGLRTWLYVAQALGAVLARGALLLRALPRRAARGRSCGADPARCGPRIARPQSSAVAPRPRGREKRFGDAGTHDVYAQVVGRTVHGYAPSAMIG